MPVTIRSRLLMLVLSVLLPAILGVTWLVGQTYEAEREAHERTLRETARALSKVVDSVLAERFAIARTLSGSPLLDQGAAASPAELARFRQLALQAMQGLQGWVELRIPGRTLLDTRRGAVEVLAATPEEEADGLVDQPVVRPLRTPSDAAQAHAAVVQPVVREGRTVANVIVALRPAELHRILEGQDLPPGWVGAILDSRDVIVARHPDGSGAVGRSAIPELQARLRTSREGLFEVVASDRRSVTGYFSTTAHGWSFWIRMPREQFAGQMPQAVAQIVAGTLALLGLAIGGALLVARHIVGPVQSLREIAARMQAGCVTPLRSTGIVELDRVATAMTIAAESLQHHHLDLERQVDAAVERTRLAEQRSSQSQRVEALGRLTGGVAHDFNNLLGVISNSAHLIQRHADAPELQLPIAATLRAVEAGSRLTQHLLRFAGRRAVRPQWVRLDSVLPELEELLRSVLGRRIAVKVKVASGARPVHVDPTEFELALINLALNARDAMPSGGELRIEARNAEADDVAGLEPGRHYVLVSVSDDGHGLDADLAERVFEPFFTTKASGQGTGLGLSQVHGFCTQAGGTARLASTPGLGTTVSLLLPAWENAAAAPEEMPRAALADATLADTRVLLVDDNEDLNRVTAALLRSLGAQVECAHDAAAALRLIDTGRGFDIVLTDMVMPGPMDGLALARQLRRDRPALPVLLTSAFHTGAPGDEFQLLRKPCPRDELVHALQDAMAARRAGAR